MFNWILLLIAITSTQLYGAEVKVISWETRSAFSPTNLRDNTKSILPLINLGVSSLPESTVMNMTFLGGMTLGLPSDKAKKLHSMLTKRYASITKDPVFGNAPSLLWYCYSMERPSKGFATIYTPDNATKDSPVILFLHGYGGSFIYYQHYLAQAFPNHIIICPAYGIGCAHIQSEYIQECLDTTSERLGYHLKTPILIGLSAGGFGGFREYVKRPKSYKGYICIAAYPPEEVLSKSPRNGFIRIIAGADEPFVTEGILRKSGSKLKQRTKNYASQVIPKDDHFFILSSEQMTKKILKKWVKQLESK